MMASEYKKLLDLKLAIKDKGTLSIIKNTTPYISKQIHKEIKRSLQRERKTICLNSISTFKNEERIIFYERVKYKDLNPKYQNLAYKIIEKEMDRLGYVKDGNITWTV